MQAAEVLQETWRGCNVLAVQGSNIAGFCQLVNHQQGRILDTKAPDRSVLDLLACDTVVDHHCITGKQ